MSADPNLNLFQANMDFLKAKSAYTRQENVVREPDGDWVAQSIAAFSDSSAAPLKLDDTSHRIFEKGISGNAFTGLVDIAQKTIYLFPLAVNDSYGNTSYPTEAVGLPGKAGAGGATAAPLPHNPQAGAPSHQTLAHKLDKDASYIGFAVTKLEDGSGKVLTVTSRSQNRESFKRNPGADNNEKIQVDLERRAGIANPGVPSEVASENWTKLIVKTIVVNLRRTT